MSPESNTMEAHQPASKLSLLRATILTVLRVILSGGILLTAFAIFNLSGPVDLGKGTKAQADLVGLNMCISIYKMKSHALPTDEQGLNALVTRPTTRPVPEHWQQTLDVLILDPWGNPYQYSCPGKHNPDGFDVYSLGPDGKPNTPDDIGNWKGQ